MRETWLSGMALWTTQLGTRDELSRSSSHLGDCLLWCCHIGYEVVTVSESKVRSNEREERKGSTASICLGTSVPSVSRHLPEYQ